MPPDAGQANAGKTNTKGIAGSFRLRSSDLEKAMKLHRCSAQA